MLRQSGVIRAENTHHMIDIAQLLAHQPLPAGRRVGILASSASLAALVAEASASAGLVVARSDFLPEDASADELAATVDALYAPDACDVVVVVQVPVVGPRRTDVSRAVADAAARTGRTTVASMLGLHGLTDELSAPAPAAEDGTGDALVRVPAYSTPEDAVAALGAVVRYARWREADHGTPVRPAGADPVRARALVEGALAGQDAVDLDPTTTAELLACYGVRVWPARRVRSADEAVEAAREVGWPVALKSTAAGLRHRADLGACGWTSRTRPSCARTSRRCARRSRRCCRAPRTSRSRSRRWPTRASRAWSVRPRTSSSGPSSRSGSRATPSTSSATSPTACRP